MNAHTSWICPQCRDYNLGTDSRCAYCGQSAEFLFWLAAVEAHLADCESSLHQLPYQLHQWWDIWDHMVSPEDAANAALILLPKMNKPWPAHAAYSTK